MVRRPPTRTAVLVTLGLLVAFVVWTALTFHLAPMQALDRRLVARPLDPTSVVGQVAAAFALLTWPGVLYVGLLGVALWAGRRRLRQLGVGLALIVVLAWGGATLLKLAIGRARPVNAMDVITTHGSSYPSGHMVAAVAVAIGVGATFAVTRQSVGAQLRWQVGSGAVVLLVAVDRWITGAHFLTDIVGGVLLGALAATVALIVAGVRVPVPQDIVQEIVRSRVPVSTEDTPCRAAVIYNPSKVTDWVTFRRHVEWELRSRGWARALFLETTPEDPGHAMTAQAVAEGVDLVLGAGGDGTIRVICAGLAHTGIPFGLIPAGTGNLLARNIGIPLDEGAALDVAFDGADKPIDLVALTVDERETHHFAVMAGIGIDAVIMENTNPDLKKAVGSAAYFVAAAQHANHPAAHATIQVDDAPPFRRRAHVIVIGNVGFLQANIPLIPDAKPDDGLLDLLVASPKSVRDWVRVTTRVLTRQNRDDSQIDRLTGRKVRITVEEKDQFQLDGDTVGECSTMTAEIQAGALLLRVPRSAAAPRKTSAELMADAPASP